MARIKYWNETSQSWEYADKTLVNGTNLTIDATLSIEGRAAEAKAVGDKISQLSSEKVDKNGLTLGVHTDGLVYLFVNGSPQGNGLDIKADVVEGDVFGYVDENNNIVLNGALAEGTYTIKYEMEDGSVIDIGDLVLDTNVYYSITTNLTQCDISNSATEVVEGESYSATITPNSGYELKSVSVTMGGQSVSVSGGVIDISNVTGNIVITAVAEEKTVEPVTVNIGLTKDYSIELTAGALRSSLSSGFCTTDFIDLTNIPKPCTIELTGACWAYSSTSSNGYVRFFATDKSGNKLVGTYTHSSQMPSGVTMVYNDTDRCSVTVTISSDNIGKIRFAGCYGSAGDAIGTNNYADAKATLTYTPES